MKHGSLISLDESQFGFGAVSAQSHAAATDGAFVTVPDAALLFNGEFKRAGSDLKIVGQDGESFLVADYFKTEKRPTLLSPEGASLSAAVVDALAGPLAPGQYAQAGTPQSANPPVGRVEKVEGNATAVRNGVTVTLNVGDVVLKGDVVQTGANSALGVVFSDGTAFNLAANARMVLNDFVYDANSSNNSALISLVQGSISFVAGQVAKTGDMRVDTPVATMGIRGTAVLVEISANNGQTKFSVMVEPNGVVGSFNLYDKSTGTLMATVNNSNIGWVVTPAGPLQVVAQQIQKTPGELQQELAIVQQVFQIYNQGQQNPFDPGSAPRPPQPTDPSNRGDNQNSNPQNTQTAQGTQFIPSGEIKITVTQQSSGSSSSGSSSSSSSSSSDTSSSSSSTSSDTTTTETTTTTTTTFNIINGTDGDDNLVGTSNADYVYAFGGTDFIEAGHGGGDDYYDGGTGFDTIGFPSADSSQPLVFHLYGISELNTADGPATGHDVFTNIEKIESGAGDDIFYIYENDEWTIDGGDGIDTLRFVNALDLTQDLGGTFAYNIEIIDFNQGLENEVEFSVADILTANPETGTLRIHADSDDIVELNDTYDIDGQLIWGEWIQGRQPVTFEDGYSDGLTFAQWEFVSYESELPETLATLYVQDTATVAIVDGSDNDAPEISLPGETHLAFDGDDYAASNEPASTQTDNVTFEAWIRWDGTGDGLQTLFYNGNSSTAGYGLMGEVDDGEMTLVGLTGGQQVLYSNVSICECEWHHVALVREDGAFRLFVDGEEAELDNAESAVNAISGSDRTFIGGNPGNAEEGFHGDIAEVRLWDVARSQSEIRTTLDVTLSGDEDGLVGYWPLNEGQGSTSSDHTAPAAHLTLSGNPEWIVGDGYGWLAEHGIATDEEQAVVVRGVYVSDFNISDETVSVTLSAGYGTLALNADPGDFLEVTGSGTTELTLSGSLSAINGALAGGFIYTPAADFNGSDTIEILADDQGHTGIGGAMSGYASIAVEVTSVNDTPVAGDDTLSSAAEDSGARTISFASLLGNDSTGPTNESGQTLTITAVSNVVGGTAAIDGTNIVFTPAASFNGTASFDYTVSDDGQTGGANDFKTDTGHVSFAVTAVPDAPQGTNATVTLTEDGSRTLSASDFGFSDPLDNPANSFAGVVITTLPGAGTLTNNGNAVSAGSMISIADINAGRLVYTPAADGNGDGHASFTFQVQDNGTVSGQQQFYSNYLPSGWTSPNGTGNVSVRPPNVSLDQTATAWLEYGHILQTVDAQQPNAISTAGATYRLSVDAMNVNGWSSAPFTISVYAGSQLLGSRSHTPSTGPKPNIDSISFDTVNAAATSGEALRVVFTPATGETMNLDNVSLRAITGPGTYGPNLLVNGDFGSQNYYIGANTDPTPNTITINVTAVNDAPVAGDETISSVAEDSGTRIISFASLFGNDSKGPANESGQSLTVTAVSNVIGGTAVIDGTNIVFTPAANFNGTASFDYTVRDDGQTNGANDFKTDTGHVSFAVTPDNDPPVNTVPGAQTVAEDQVLTFSVAGGNPIAISDVDVGETASPNNTMEVTLTVTNGILNAVTGGGATIADNGTDTVTITGTLAQVRAALDGLTYRGNQHFNGTETLTVTSDDLGHTSGAAGATLTPVTGEIKVSENTSNARQEQPDIAVLPDGKVIAVWWSAESGDKIQGRMQSADGTLLENSDFTVSTSGGGASQPSVAALEGANAGKFVVSFNNSGDIAARIFDGTSFDGSGNPQAVTVSGSTNQFSVNSSTPGNQFQSSVTALSNGGFVVTWSTDTGDGDSYSVRGRVFDANGAPLANDFQINTETASLQWAPSVTTLANGNFLVTWEDYSNASGGGSDVRGRLFDANGNALAGPDGDATDFVIPAPVAGQQLQPSVSALANGGFVVVWSDTRLIQGRIFDANGVATANHFQIDKGGTGNDEQTPSVAGLEGGGFVVVWVHGQTVGGDGISARIFDASGNVVSINGSDNDIAINQTATDFPEAPEVTARAGGGFAVTWYDFNNNGGRNADIYTRLYDFDSGAGKTDTDTVSIAVNAVNDAPAIDPTDAPLTYTRQSTVYIDPDLSVSDVDDAQLNGVTIQISNGVQSGDLLKWHGYTSGSLTFVGGNTIYFAFNGSSHMMELWGGATVAEYQEFLREITLNNPSEDPTAGGTANSRTLTWVAFDGETYGAPATRTVNVVVNDAPELIPTRPERELLPSLEYRVSGVFIADDDAGDSPLRLTVSADKGTLDADYAEGLNILDGDGSDGTLQFEGTLDALNEMLSAGLLHSIADEEEVIETISVIVDDQQGGTDTINFVFPLRNHLSLSLIEGTDGRDVMFGSDGSDGIAGGLGNDTFFFRASTGSPANSNNDAILDFDRGHDKIIVSQLGVYGFSDLESYMQEIDGDTFIQFGMYDSLIVLGVTGMTEQDFGFIPLAGPPGQMF